MVQENNSGTESIELQDSKTENSNGQDQKKETETKANVISLTQSELDNKIANAVFKALDKQKQKTEIELQKAKGNHEDVIKSLESKLQELEAEKEQNVFNSRVLDYLGKKNLSSYSETFLKLKSFEDVMDLADKLETISDSLVNEKVNLRLGTKKPIATNGTQTILNEVPMNGNVPDFSKIVDTKERKEAYNAWKKTNRLM